MAKVLGALPAIRSLRERIATLPELDQHAIDALEDYAHATMQADSLHTIALSPLGDTRAMYAAARGACPPSLRRSGAREPWAHRCDEDAQGGAVHRL